MTNDTMTNDTNDTNTITIIKFSSPTCSPCRRMDGELYTLTFPPKSQPRIITPPVEKDIIGVHRLTLISEEKEIQIQTYADLENFLMTTKIVNLDNSLYRVYYYDLQNNKLLLVRSTQFFWEIQIERNCAKDKRLIKDLYTMMQNEVDDIIECKCKKDDDFPSPKPICWNLIFFPLTSRHNSLGQIVFS